MTVPLETADLAHGRMPLLGFGTWQIKGVAAPATRSAGHWTPATGTWTPPRSTATRRRSAPGSPPAVSPATTCSSRRSARRSNAGKELATLRTSLDLLGTDRVDLWLIHWPGGNAADVGIWRAFAEAREQGLARDIGVSNYSLAQIDELTRETGVTPAVNQVEWSPLLFDRAVLDGHRERGVVLEGYSALRGGTLEHPAIVAIADRLGRTPGAGHHPLAPAAPHRRHPEVGAGAADPVQRRRRRLHADRRRHGRARRPRRLSGTRTRQGRVERHAGVRVQDRGQRLDAVDQPRSRAREGRVRVHRPQRYVGQHAGSQHLAGQPLGVRRARSRTARRPPPSGPAAATASHVVGTDLPPGDPSSAPAAGQPPPCPAPSARA